MSLPPPSSIAVLGTGSDVGKSIIAAGVCRILSNGGLTVAPFKAQNMSNNSHPAIISSEYCCDSLQQQQHSGGYGEIGVAQAIQAQACRQLARVEMNPVLLKSGGQRPSDGAYLCSVHVLGRHWATEDYGELGQRTGSLMDLVLAAHQRLHHLTQSDVIVLEGAGSCTELNLMERDIVNIPLVRKLQCPWILVANIDPGGVFAQIVGTKACLSDEDWELCACIIVNKLRGDVQYFEPGPSILQEWVGKPIFVVPYLNDLNIAEEDGMGLERKLASENNYDHHNSAAKDTLNTKTVVVVCYPHLSMMDDLLPVEMDERFEVQWRRNCIPVGRCADNLVVVLPGSRQTRTDLEWLMQSRWKGFLQEHADNGGCILGLCGGYQMLGVQVTDKIGVEAGNVGTTEGLGLLPVETHLNHTSTKVIRPHLATMLIGKSSDVRVEGFEIHCGRSRLLDAIAGYNVKPLLRFQDGQEDGLTNGRIHGTYLHGILNTKDARTLLLGTPELETDVGAEVIDPFDRLAEHLAIHGLDFDTLKGMLNNKDSGVA